MITIPLYDYVCAKCKKYYEVIVPLNKSGEEIKCPHCKKKMVKKVMPVYFTIK